MKWLDTSKEPCALECVYCGQSGKFTHVKSYEHKDEILSLYACTKCKSLIYDLNDIEAPVVSQADAPAGVISNEARWTVETGFSSYYVAACAMSTLPEIPDHELRNHVFVDVGAGMGMASHFVKTLFGMPVVTIEPSYTGKLAQELLGLHVHRAYFEDLPEDVLAELANKPCLLHLNSVVEHLVDPAAVLADMIGRARVDVLAAIVPDGAAMDFDGPFLNALPFLAPRDHRHLPTELGVELLLKRLGFQHVVVEVSSGLLTGIGSRYPMPVSSERMNRLSEQVFLENLKRHPNPIVATGGASRLLPGAVLNGNTPLVTELVAFFQYEDQAADLLEKVVGRDWDHLEFHLGQTCYWLAYTALQGGRLQNALALLEITKAFADAMAEDYPPQCMTALEYKWAAMILESHILNAMGDPSVAEGPLLAVIAAKSDPNQGPRDTYVHQAEIALQVLRAGEAKTGQDSEVAETTA